MAPGTGVMPVISQGVPINAKSLLQNDLSKNSGTNNLSITTVKSKPTYSIVKYNIRYNSVGYIRMIRILTLINCALDVG